MASTVELPLKSTRHMDAGELRDEAARLGIAVPSDVEDLRRAVKGELERRWSVENRDALESINRWVEKHGLPLAKYRVW